MQPSSQLGPAKKIHETRDLELKRVREELEEERKKSNQIATHTKKLSTLIEAFQIDLTNSKREAELYKKQVIRAHYLAAADNCLSYSVFV